jgi:hypothetical protein
MLYFDASELLYLGAFPASAGDRYHILLLAAAVVATASRQGAGDVME